MEGVLGLALQHRKPHRLAGTRLGAGVRGLLGRVGTRTHGSILISNWWEGEGPFIDFS